MSYIRYPKSFIMLIQYETDQIGYIVFHNQFVDHGGVLEAKNYIEARSEVRKRLRKTSFASYPICRDITKKYVELFLEMMQ